MRFSHQNGDVEVIRAANLADVASQNAAIVEGTLKGVTVALVAGVATTALAGCGGGGGKEVANILPVPAIECSNVSAVPGEIDNWSYGGVVKVWDGKSMTMSYAVQKGDSLSAVAQCYFVNPEKGVEAVAHENRIADPNLISPGKELKITIFNPVKVQLGDKYETINDLAAETGLGVGQIYAANGKSFPKDQWNPSNKDVIILPVQNNVDQDPEPITTTTTTTTTEPTPVPAPSGELPRTDEINEFRQRWDEYASAVEKKFGIDKNAILAQAILESDFASSELAIDGSNLFGIKAHRGAETTPYWAGGTMPHETTEFLSDKELKDSYWQKRIVKVIGKTGDGINEVRVDDDFRVYDSFKRSFLDYGYKIVSEHAYKKAAAQIGKNPIGYIKAVAAAGYASDPAYIAKVTDLYEVLVELSKTGEPELPSPEPPKPGKGDIIKPEELDFSNFPSQERDAKLQKTIEKATEDLSLEGFKEFRKKGVLDKYNFARGVMSGDGEYHQLLGRNLGDGFKYVVWHLWANGIANNDVDAIGGTKTTSSQGNSHDIPLESQVQSWHNGYEAGRPASAQYLVGDNGEVWRLTKTATDNKALHVGHGIIDEGKEKFPLVSNENAIGLEVQADTIYDVGSNEFTILEYQTANLLIQGKLVNKNMSADEIRSIVNNSVIGHGKNDSRFNNSGVEFGWKYRTPLVQGVQELLVAYLKR